MEAYIYLDPNNIKSSFAATYHWWVKREAARHQVLTERELTPARRSIQMGKPLKGNAPMSHL